MIQILFFGRIAELMAKRSQTLTMPESELSLMTVRDQIFEPLIADGRLDAKSLKMSVNQIVVSGDQRLRPGDEVAFFSLFSGG